MQLVSHGPFTGFYAVALGARKRIRAVKHPLQLSTKVFLSEQVEKDNNR